MKPPTESVLYGVALATVAFALVAGFFALGSPMEERSRRIDERRVSDLQGIVTATDLFWTRHSQLPASLGELTAEPGVRISTADPESAMEYGYRVLDSIHFEVCATFEGESGEISTESEEDLWAHGPGQQCFQLDAEEITRGAAATAKLPSS